MDPRRIPIPYTLNNQLIGYIIFGRCWLFASEHYEPSYWMMLKREGFSGDLVTSSSELTQLSMWLRHDQLAEIFYLHHRREPDHWFTGSLRDDVEVLILSGRIKVFQLEEDLLYRLANPNDVLYASRAAIELQSENPIIAKRFALAEELGSDIVNRWTKKDSEDHIHWNRFVLWREMVEGGDVVVELADTIGDFVVGLKDIAVFVIDIAYEAHKVQLKLLGKYFEMLGKASRGDIDGIKNDLRELGIWLNDAIDSAEKLINEAKKGAAMVDRLLSDPITRGLLFDYLDSLYQSVPYRDSRTLMPRLVFEIGIEVLLALATGGIANAARRSGQAAAAARRTSQAATAAKRIGPFTEDAINLMVDLSKVLDTPSVKVETPPPPKIDVPDYAKRNSDTPDDSRSNKEQRSRKTNLASYDEFCDSVEEFENGGPLAEQSYKLYKEENWTELEELFNRENINGGWPPNRGAITHTEVTLPKGSKIDRYGGYIDQESGLFRDQGTFTARMNEPFENRALPNSTLSKPYKQYEVVKDIPSVIEGEAIPWFGQRGKGIQYETPMSVEKLIQNGYLREI